MTYTSYLTRIAALGLAVGLAGCAKGHVQTTAIAATGPLPPPAHVVITDFTVSAGDVHLDNGIGATLRRQAQGEGADQALAQSAADTQSALSETLAQKLSAYGLPVERLPASVVPPAGSLLVQGQIVAVNQGNRTRRTLIGLGAGRSSVTADAQLYYMANPASPQFLQSFSGSADSGKMPGAAETMGVGAAAGTLATSAAVTAASHTGAEMYRTGDAANAAKLADALARQIGLYAAAQGWIPQGVVQ
jgi:hypothetical protein